MSCVLPKFMYSTVQYCRRKDQHIFMWMGQVQITNVIYLDVIAVELPKANTSLTSSFEIVTFLLKLGEQERQDQDEHNVDMPPLTSLPCTVLTVVYWYCAAPHCRLEVLHTTSWFFSHADEEVPSVVQGRVGFSQRRTTCTSNGTGLWLF